MGLGHARLSIIDLATGDQPIANEDENLHVVVNGEFYDYERYQKDLEGRGHRLRTRSDSEILVHLYEELEAARPFLTDTVYKRQKHPFMAPPELKGRLRELAEDTLRGPTLASVPLFDRAAVIRFLDDEPNVPPERRALYYPTWLTMLSTCLLQQRYGM